MEKSKNVWTEPKLEPLDVDLSAVETGNNTFIDGSNSNNLSKNS